MGDEYTTARRSPLYCERDGVALVETTESRPPKYDRYTGKPYDRLDRISRACPTEGHDVWIYVSHGDGWARR